MGVSMNDLAITLCDLGLLDFPRPVSRVCISNEKPLTLTTAISNVARAFYSMISKRERKCRTSWGDMVGLYACKIVPGGSFLPTLYVCYRSARKCREVPSSILG